MADTTVNISPLEALAMATTNIEKLYGLDRDQEVGRYLERDFVAWEGGDVMEFGGSKVAAFSTSDGIAVF